jgi:cyclin-dependent kinase
MAEMANGRPLVAGTSEADQLDKIFRLLGTPTVLEYPGIVELPEYTSELPSYPPPRNGIGSLVPRLDSQGVDLLSRMLKFDPARRITAQDALSHVYFDDIIKVSPATPRVLK